jgi:hypothetical protein
VRNKARLVEEREALLEPIKVLIGQKDVTPERSTGEWFPVVNTRRSNNNDS